MLFEELVREYRRAKTEGAYRTKVVRANTWEGYESALRTHLLPKWSGRDVEDIGYEEVQDWVDSFDCGAEKAYKTLRQLVRWAINKLHLRIADPTIGIDVPKPSRRPKRVPDAAGLNEMAYRWQGEEWEASAIVMAFGGLRRCEGAALTWRDVNLSTGVVRVNKGRHVVGGKVFVWATKTEMSTREVVLPHYAVLRLREIKRERRARPDELLCNLRPDAMSRRFRSWCRRNGFKGMTMMNLRHTYATVSVQAGVPIEDVARNLGHTGLELAYTTYVCSTIALKRANAKRFGGFVLSHAPKSRLRRPLRPALVA